MESLLNKLKKRYSKHLHKLFDYGDLGLLTVNDGTIAYKGTGAVFKNDIDELLKMVLDRDFDKLEHEDEDSEEFLAVFAPCHALMALEDIEAYDSSVKLRTLFDNIDEEDEYYNDALIYFFAMSWSYNIKWFKTILSSKESVQKKSYIFNIMKEAAKWNKSENLSPIESIVVDFLKLDKNSDSQLNALAIKCLVEIDGVKHIDFIRECFENKNINPFSSGNLIDIEMELGLMESSHTKPKILTRLFSSIKNLL